MDKSRYGVWQPGEAPSGLKNEGEIIFFIIIMHNFFTFWIIYFFSYILLCLQIQW